MIAQLEAYTNTTTPALLQQGWGVGTVQYWYTHTCEQRAPSHTGKVALGLLRQLLLDSQLATLGASSGACSDLQQAHPDVLG